MSADIRKAVTDAVTSLLLESDVMDKIIQRYFKTHALPSPAGTPSSNPADQETVKAVIQSEFQGQVQSEMKRFLSSTEFKELMDDKFRTITLYLKTEVIPGVVKKSLAK